jgi:hypothetical protein
MTAKQTSDKSTLWEKLDIDDGFKEVIDWSKVNICGQLGGKTIEVQDDS